MSKPYGKIPRKASRPQPSPPSEIQINIAGRYTLEQLSHELAKAVARLQEHGVYGVQKMRMHLQPLDEKGQGIALWDEQGKAVETIQIPDVPPEPPYRS